MPRTYPYLLIYESKHVSEYFHITDKESNDKAYFHILENYAFPESKWMENYQISEYDLKEKPDFTLEEVNSLPDSMQQSKAEMLLKLKKWDKIVKQAQEYRDDYVIMKNIIDNKLYDLASDMLWNMDYEIKSETYSNI